MSRVLVMSALAFAVLSFGACSGEPSDLDKLKSELVDANNAVQVAQNMCKGNRSESDDENNKLCQQLDNAQARIDDATEYANKLK
jgi:hypothetical protein